MHLRNNPQLAYTPVVLGYVSCISHNPAGRFGILFRLKGMEGLAEMAEYIKKTLLSGDILFDYYGDDQNNYFVESNLYKAEIIKRVSKSIRKPVAVLYVTAN